MDVIINKKSQELLTPRLEGICRRDVPIGIRKSIIAITRKRTTNKPIIRTARDKSERKLLHPEMIRRP